jgi:hypothetical protein
MIQIDESYVDAAAPNAAAIKNGRGLVLKRKFVRFNQLGLQHSAMARPGFKHAASAPY